MAKGDKAVASVAEAKAEKVSTAGRVLRVGGKYNKPMKWIDSPVGTDGRVDADKVKAYDAAHVDAPFWTEDAEGKVPRFYGECWFPYIVAGDKLDKAEALARIGGLIDQLDEYRAHSPTDRMIVENAEGKVLYDGPVGGLLKSGNVADRSLMPIGSADGDKMTSGSFVCALIKDRLGLNHQQDMNGVERRQMHLFASDNALLKGKATSSGRTRNERLG